jgi:hypothetical protein
MSLFSLENITLFIALWGAILSTYKVLSDYMKRTRKLKVELAYGVGRYQGGQIGPPIISIIATNIYLLPDNQQILFLEPQSSVKFPCSLSEGKQCVVWQTQRELAKDLKNHGYSGKIKLRGYYKSATGETYKSKSIGFNVEYALSKNE